MDDKQVNRREFLQTAALVGAAAMTVSSTFKVLGADAVPQSKTAIFVCSRCGHIEFGAAPDACPVCHSPKEDFQQNDAAFSDAQNKYKEKTVSHAPFVTAKNKSSLVNEEPAIEVAVKVGKTIHPMEQSHFIRFIDCYIDDKHVSRMMLTLGSFPTANINIKTPGSKVRIVALCNLHGYWQTEIMPS
jgi:superoxide reductase